MNQFSGKQIARAAIGAVAALSMAPAFAHPGDHHVVTSLAAGFVHPFSGLDHLLAFGAVGLWAAQYRGRATWQLPLLFLVVMAFGALLPLAGMTIPGAETGIAASVAILGLLIVFAFKVPTWAGVTILSTFAVLHGYAHGVELPQNASAALYGIGFIAATALLHLGGFVIGTGIAGKAVRFAGAGIAATGVCLLAGMV